MKRTFSNMLFLEQQERSQEIDYPPKRKKPYWAKGHTFPEIEGLHEGTFKPGMFGPMYTFPKLDPCAGRVLLPAGTQQTLPCGEKNFNIEVSGAVGPVNVDLNAGEINLQSGANDDAVSFTTYGNHIEGTILNCIADDFITIPITDNCPGYSTFTLWFDKCPCESFSISCGANSTVCGSSVACYLAIPSTGTKQFTATGATGTVKWSLSPGGSGWSVDATGKVTTSGACGSQTLTAIDDNCCSINLTISVGYDLTMSCSSPPCDTITKSSSKTYSVSGSSGTVTWSVTGTGATINQSGVLTTDSTACGMLTVTATDTCGGCAKQSVRVTNGGSWCLIGTETISSTNCCGCSQCYVGAGFLCDVISGDTMNSYYGFIGCLSKCGGPSSTPECSLPAAPCSGYTCPIPCASAGCTATAGSPYGGASYNIKYTYQWKCSC